jgi:hypothetical protein
MEARGSPATIASIPLLRTGTTAVARKVFTTARPVTRSQAVTDRAYREWSSTQVSRYRVVP